jgi:hypothetical protein
MIFGANTLEPETGSSVEIKPSIDIPRVGIGSAVSNAVSARSVDVMTGAGGGWSPAIMLESKVWGQKTPVDPSQDVGLQAALVIIPNPANGGIGDLHCVMRRVNSSGATSWGSVFVIGGTDPYGNAQGATFYQRLFVHGPVLSNAGTSAFQIRDTANSERTVLCRRGNSGADANDLLIKAMGNGLLVEVQDAAGAPASLAALNTLVPQYVTGTSQAMVSRRSYTASSSSLTTLTLPSAAGVGEQLGVRGYGAGGWVIAQSGSQTVHVGSSSTTPGSSGQIASQNRYDDITLECIVANTVWKAVAVVGSPRSVE